MLNSTVSVTGDLGEASTFHYRADVRDNFGQWITAEDNRIINGAVGGQSDFDFDAEVQGFDFGEGDDIQDDAANRPDREECDYPGEDAYIVDLSKCVYIPGPHHILHNLTKGLPE
eukprot:3255270-Pyramimonas_sp.AAC.1